MRKTNKKFPFSYNGKISWPLFDLSGSCKVTQFGTKWKGKCDFLCVNNSNLHSILNRSWVISVWKFEKHFVGPHSHSTSGDLENYQFFTIAMDRIIFAELNCEDFDPSFKTIWQFLAKLWRKNDFSFFVDLDLDLWPFFSKKVQSHPCVNTL